MEKSTIISTPLHQNHTKYTDTVHQMATFLKRGKTWRCQITKKVGSEIIRRSATFPTKAQASAWALETESALVGLKRVGVTGSLIADNQGMTVQEVIDRYMREVAPLHRGAKREITTLMKISREHQWLVVKPLNEVTHGDLAKFRDLRLQHVSGATVAREMVMISSMFGTACREWGAADDNPAKGVRRPKEPGAREVRIPPEAVQALSGALGMSPPVHPDTKKRQVGLAFLIALETAMRQGEILGLTWDRVRFDKKYVLLDKTKNGQARHVPLSQEAMRLLKFAEGIDSVKVFTVTSASADTIFRKARPSEWGHIHFHDSRHEAVFNVKELILWA